MEVNMGGGILLWLLGVPIPIIILLVLLLSLTGQGAETWQMLQRLASPASM
jgi:hypothetical protein